MRERREGRDAHDSLSSLCPPPRARGARTTHRRPATRRVVVRPARAGRDREVDMANAIFGLSVFAVGEERVIKKERVPASRAPPGAQTRENSLSPSMHLSQRPPRPPGARSTGAPAAAAAVKPKSLPSPPRLPAPPRAEAAAAGGRGAPASPPPPTAPAPVTDASVPEGHKGLHASLYGEGGAEEAHGVAAQAEDVYEVVPVSVEKEGSERQMPPPAGCSRPRPAHAPSNLTLFLSLSSPSSSRARTAGRPSSRSSPGWPPARPRPPSPASSPFTARPGPCNT